MNIRELHVEGFGRWNALSLRGFAPGLNVVYGPNESGKTTLLEFIRTVLYGFAPERRQRYVSPRGGSPAGGSIVFAQDGRLRTLARRETGDAAGHLLLIDPDGTVHEQPPRDGYLGIDESVFCRVFAVGLRELQELATLTDAEVATRLYELGAGDRSGLTSAVRDLRSARQRLLGNEWRTSPIGVLTDRAARLRTELQDLSGLGARHARATAGLKEAQAALPPLEASLADLQNRLRVADAAAAVGDRLRQRVECLRELEALGEAPNLPDDLARRLEVCKDHIRARRRKIRELKQRREQLRTNIEKIEVNEGWLRQAPHVAAAAEQAEWAAAEAKRAGEIQREVDARRAQLEAEVPAETRKPAAAQPATLRRHISPRDVKQIKPLEKALRAAADQRQQSEAAAAELEHAAIAASEQIDEALGARGEEDMPTALDAATEDVRHLRQRVQLDQRIGHLENSLAELDQDPVAPATEPLLSVGSLVGLGALFVLGMPLIFAWAVMTGPLSWFLGLLGLAGIGGGVALKLRRDKHGPRDAATAAAEAESLQQQIDEAKAERAQLDQQLGIPAGKAAEKLREAEKQLMEWEKLAPLDHEAQAAQADAADARAAADQAAATHQEAEEAWNAALRQLGLAEGLTYQQVCDHCRVREREEPIARVSVSHADLRQQLQARERDLQEARRGQQEFGHRLQRVFQELGLSVPVGQAAAKLQEVRNEIVRQDELFRRRQELMTQLRRLRRRVVRLCLQGKRWARRRRSLLRQAGVTSEVEFYRRLQAFARHDELRKRLAELDREIASRLCGTATIEEITAALQQTPPDPLGETRHALRAQFHAAQQQLTDLRHRLGEFDAELKRLAKDSSPAEKRLELGAALEQLRQATEQWQVLAAGSFFLDKVRHVYERERQPEVLRESSRYLAAMTGQKYPRVWTPLDEDALRIDTAEGETLGVDVLSSGTREQLFLCLRLALAKSYARRGVELPLVLDDVLVNFDTRRSLAAARLLRDYAADGQQVLLFTCHEHVAQMFRALDVAVQTLPEIGEDRPALPEPKAMPVMPSRKPLVPAAHAMPSPAEPANDAWAA